MLNNFSIGSKVLRKEDDRLISGNGNYIDDINIENQCYAYLVRSPHANAKILSIDKSTANTFPGVISILSLIHI